MMNQDKAYETLMQHALDAIDRIDEIYKEKMERKSPELDAHGHFELLKDYLGALTVAATLVNSAGLLRPFTTFNGFCAGPLEKEEA